MEKREEQNPDIPVNQIITFMTEKGITARLINDYPEDSLAQEAIEFEQDGTVLARVEFTADGRHRPADIAEFERRQARPFMTGRLIVPMRRLVKISHATDKEHPGLASTRFDRIFGRNQPEA